MKVYSAIANVMRELAQDGIGKSRKNTQQGYAFRGIDDVYNSLATLLAKHGLVIVPSYRDRVVDVRETKNGGTLSYVTLTGVYRVSATEDGSTVEAVTIGEAMDAGDKATNKAMSAAYKNMAIQLFCIPTEGDNDADATTHEVAARKPAARPPARAAAPPPEQADPLVIIAKLREAETLAELEKWAGVARLSLPEQHKAEARDTYIARKQALVDLERADQPAASAARQAAERER